MLNVKFSFCSSTLVVLVVLCVKVLKIQSLDVSGAGAFVTRLKHGAGKTTFFCFITHGKVSSFMYISFTYIWGCVVLRVLLLAMAQVSCTRAYLRMR
jgi:hypothetical protein